MAVSVVCVKWGTKYGPEYVNRLCHGIRRHVTSEVAEKLQFFCLTDDAEGLDERTVKVLPLDDFGWCGWWNKVQIFGPVVNDAISDGLICYVDLDTVVVSDISHLLDYRSYGATVNNPNFFATLATESLKSEGRVGGYNSSVMVWPAANACGDRVGPTTTQTLFSFIRSYYKVGGLKFFFICSFDPWVTECVVAVGIDYSIDGPAF